MIVVTGFLSMACRFGNVKRFEDYEHKCVYIARVSRKPGFISWSFDCQGHFPSFSPCLRYCTYWQCIAGSGSVITKAQIEVNSVHSQFGKIKWEIIVDSKRHSKLPGSASTCS